MTHQIPFTIVFILSFLGVILLSEFLYAKFAFSAEITRKTAHTLATLFSLIFLTTFQSYWYVVILALVFFLLLVVGKRFQLFQSIFGVQRKTAGSYLLPLAIGLLFVISKETDNRLLFILPILILGISDPLAGLFGTLYGDHTRRVVLFHHEFDKTFMGSSVFCLSAFVITLVVLPFFAFTGYPLLLAALGVAVLATFVEFISSYGTDNITVPLVLCLVLYWLSTA